MYYLKFVNICQYLHQSTWFHRFSPKIKIYAVIFWFVFNFYYPLTIFWFIIVIVLNSSLQLPTKVVLLHYSYIYQICFSGFIFLILTVISLPSPFFRHFFLMQVIPQKISNKYFQYSLLIHRTYSNNFNNTSIFRKIFILYLLLKQYLLLISYLYFGKLLVITTIEDELTYSYISLFMFNKQSDINQKKLLFCISVTKQYEYLIINKTIDILCSIKFRGTNFYNLDFSCNFICLITFYLEVFVSSLLIYAQKFSECLYSRELMMSVN